MGENTWWSGSFILHFFSDVIKLLKGDRMTLCHSVLQVRLETGETEIAGSWNCFVLVYMNETVKVVELWFYPKHLATNQQWPYRYTSQRLWYSMMRIKKLVTFCRWYHHQTQSIQVHGTVPVLAQCPGFLMVNTNREKERYCLQDTCQRSMKSYLA